MVGRLPPRVHEATQVMSVRRLVAQCHYLFAGRTIGGNKEGARVKSKHSHFWKDFVLTFRLPARKVHTSSPRVGFIRIHLVLVQDYQLSMYTSV
jgi:hypothetical protein